MIPLVLYHGNCWDGFCAAWVAKKFLGEIEAIPVQYGLVPPDVTNRNVYILDFSYPRHILKEMILKAEFLVVLDHHKTAETELKDLAKEIEREGGAWEPIIRFDMLKSGGQLTWDYFFEAKKASWLVDYTADRDLWRWELPFSKEINTWLRSYPLDFDRWDLLALQDPLDKVDEGRAILRCEKYLVVDHVARAYDDVIAGYTIPVVNATCFVSEIVGELAKGKPFAACFFYTENGQRCYSLRSDPNGIDVSEIAKKFGGGGHKHAAGFLGEVT